tara:strand:- start:1 stop:663 length:663 start_codon:yes stop_codon:yes gene_type:complete
VKSSQIPFDLGVRSALDRQDFFVHDSNRQAVSWLDKWPTWPSKALFIHGPSGCGKSHLVSVFATRAQAVMLEPSHQKSLHPVELADRHQAIVCDGIGQKLEEEFLLHMFNAAHEAGKYLLFADCSPAARWNISLPDLQSRMTSIPSVRMFEPDEIAMSAVLIKLFNDRQLIITPELVSFIINRIPRTFSAVQMFVEKVDREALAQKSKITIPLAKQIIEA